MVGASDTKVRNFLVYEYDEQDTFTTNIIGVYNDFNKAYTKILPYLTSWRELVYFIEEWQEDECVNVHRY